MGKTCYHPKPFLLATVLMGMGVLLILFGAVLQAETRSMDAYAWIAFGVLLIVAALVIFGMYGRMELEVRRILRGKPLLRYRVPREVLAETVERQIRQLKATNRGLLWVMLAFCALFGILLPFFVEDALTMACICLGLAIFLILSEKIVTGYRVRKLQNSTDEFWLAETGAMIGGQFYGWNLPGCALTHVEYRPPEGSGMGELQLVYAAEGRAGRKAQTLLFPIPPTLESEMPTVMGALRRAME